MAYDDERTKLSRIPVQYVKITLPECASTFSDGVSCHATVLNKCYQTYPTCKDRTHWNPNSTHSYGFVSNDAPLPFRTGERPYVKSVSHLPQQIKNEVTVKQRVTVDLYDEPDNDVVTEGYAWLMTEDGKIIITEDDTAIAAEGILVESSVPSYFKKLFARHQDWYNRQIEIYEGFYVATNLSIDNFKRKFIGKIKEVEVNGNNVKIEAVDYLQNLADIEYPPPTQDVTLKRAYDVSSAWTAIKVNNPQNLSTGYISIGEQILHLATLSTVTGKGVIDSRGDFLTLPADAGKGAAVQLCKFVTPQSPFDIMTTLLSSWASIPSSSIDTTALTNLKSWPGRECYMTQLLSEPKGLDELFEDLLRITECHAYIDENQKIVIGRNFLKNSTNPWQELTDSAHIIEHSEKVKLDSDNIITQGVLEWDEHVAVTPQVPKKFKKKYNYSTKAFSQKSVYTDTEAESSFYHDQQFSDNFKTGWLHTVLSYPGSDIGEASLATSYSSTDPYAPDNVKAYADGWIRRYVLWRSRPKQIYELDVEYKDSTIAVGDQLLVSGNVFLDSSGNSLDKVPCFISKKQPNEDWTQSLTMEDYGARVGLIAPDTQVDYTSALSSQLEYGFICSSNVEMSNGNKGYVIY